MANFVPRSIVKSAIRTLITEIPTLAAFSGVVDGILTNNPNGQVSRRERRALQHLDQPHGGLDLRLHGRRDPYDRRGLGRRGPGARVGAHLSHLIGISISAGGSGAARRLSRVVGWGPAWPPVF